MFIPDDNFYSHINPYDSSLCEMMEARRFEDFKICVYGQEGPIPHFHFYVGGDMKSGGCIRLDKPEYFNHGHYKEKINRRLKNHAIQWLHSKPKSKLGALFKNNWEAMCYMWEIGNPDHPLPDSLEIPDYRKLK